MDTTNLMKGASMFLAGATLGTTLTFGTINTFNGGDLQTLEQEVTAYQDIANEVVSELEQDWSVQIDSANAEIEDYKQALAQANNNIIELKDKATTLNDTWEQITIAQAEQLTQQQQQTDAETQAQIDALVEQANAEIGRAEEEIKKLKDTIKGNIEDDDLTNYNRPTFELDDENEIYVENAELDFNMPNKPDDDETTGGETGGTESGGTVMEQGSVAFIEIELASVLGDDIYVQFDGMEGLPVYRQAGTNKFRIEVSDLALLTSSRQKVLNVSYCDADFNDVEATLIITDSVNSFVGTYTPTTTGLGSDITSLKVVVE